MLEKQEKKLKRQRRVRAKIFGTKEKPRFSVFRSAKHIYAQLIDDERGISLAAADDRKLKKSKMHKQSPKDAPQDLKLTPKREIAYEVGKLIAEKALEKKIGKVIFDRGGYKYHGRIKSLAEGAMEGGLRF